MNGHAAVMAACCSRLRSRQRLCLRLQFLQRSYGGAAASIDFLAAAAVGDELTAVAQSCGARVATASTRSRSRTSVATGRAVPRPSTAPRARSSQRNDGCCRASSRAPGAAAAMTAWLRDATTGAVVAHASATGLDTRALLDFARSAGGPLARTDLSRARGPAQGPGEDAGRAQGGVLPALLRHRRHQGRLMDRHRRRYQHAVRVCEQGHASCPTAVSTSMAAWKRSSKQRQLCRPAYLRTAGRRRRAHQRLQLPGVGHAGEARPGAARRRSGDREARHCRPATSPSASSAASWSHVSCPRVPCSSSAVRWATCSIVSAARTCVSFTGSAATALKLRQHPAVMAKLGALHGRDRLAQLLDPRHRRRQPARPSSICSYAKWCAR